jgi:hypothetical protein
VIETITFALLCALLEVSLLESDPYSDLEQGKAFSNSHHTSEVIFETQPIFDNDRDLKLDQLCTIQLY